MYGRIELNNIVEKSKNHKKNDDSNDAEESIKIVTTAIGNGLALGSFYG